MSRDSLDDAAFLWRLGAPTEPGAIGWLALALLRRWDAGALFVNLTAYIDESGTHNASPVIVLGGYVARLGQWIEFDLAWRRLLKRYGLTYFHAKEMFHKQGEFAGWSEDRKVAFMRDALKRSKKHTLFGFTASLRRADYQQYYRDRLPKRGLRWDSPYGLCIRHCASFLPRFLSESFPTRRGLSLNFVLEEHEHVGDAVRIVSELRERAEDANIRGMLGTISAGQKKAFAGLQAADSIVYAALKTERDPTALPVVDFDGKVLSEASRSEAAPVFRIALTPKILVEHADSKAAASALKRARGTR